VGGRRVFVRSEGCLHRPGRAPQGARMAWLPFGDRYDAQAADKGGRFAPSTTTSRLTAAENGE
jgi:hypothetical protein